MFPFTPHTTLRLDYCSGGFLFPCDARLRPDQGDQNHTPNESVCYQDNHTLFVDASFSSRNL